MGFVSRALWRRAEQWLETQMKKPEVAAAVERLTRAMDVARLAGEVARTVVDDDTACRELRGRLPDDAEAGRRAVEHLSALRTGYLKDRAYRLLTAALTSTPVREIDPAVREQFLAEAALGRMSLHDAFEHLAALEPRLRELPPWRPPAPGTWVRRSEPLSVGPRYDGPHPILRTEMARLVVGEHQCAPNDTSPVPFLARPPRVSTGTSLTFGRDSRPRAAN